MDSTIIASIITAVGAIISAIIAGTMSRQPSHKENNNKAPKRKWILTCFILFILFACSSIVFFLYFKFSKEQLNGGELPTESVMETVLPTPTESLGDNEASAPSLPISIDSSPKYVEIGSIQTMGKFEQDNDKNNGAEDIQWLVIKQEGDEILLISVLGLKPLPYARGRETADWESSSIREWLNGTFYQTVFSAEEKSLIVEKDIEQDDNDDYPNCDQGNKTTDHVFLLSSKEYIEHMRKNINIDTEYCYGTPSKYAVKEGASLYNKKYCWWWLRTSSKNNEVACTVTPYGASDPNSGGIRSTDILVRPAMWVKIS